MVVVISNDVQLHHLTREVLAESGQETLLATPDCRLDSATDDDICIIDWSDDSPLQKSVSEDARGLHLYIVDRGQVDKLPDVLPNTTIGVLLKPTNRSALRLSLQQGIDASGARAAASRRAANGDRDDILQSLLQAYLRLQEHENDRATFLARVLHDFRAPLTAINGYCGLFLEEALGPLRPKQRDALLRMHRSATRLSRLALSLFDLTVHERVTAETRVAEGCIHASADQAIDEVRPACQDRDIAISVELEEQGGRLFFDSAQMEQLLVNLLENAVRFTSRHGVVELRGYPYFWKRPGAEERSAAFGGCAAAEFNSYRIDVRDYGPPIAPDVLSLIFEEYYSNSQTSDRSSGGLGLAICRLIVRGHSGAIWATSGSEGTVFSFVRPFRAETSETTGQPPFAAMSMGS